MYKACIFDLDGTLTNTINSIAYFGNNALAQYGYPPIEAERYKLLVGDGADTLVTRMIEEVNGSMDDFEHIRSVYNITYDNDFLYKTELYPGVKSLVQTLKSKGVLCAVLTNKPHGTALKVVESFFGADCFDLILGQREGVPKKPDPAGALEIARAFNVEPSACLYVGDTATDMKTGNGAGMHTIGVLWGFRDEAELVESNAKVIISTPDELLQKFF